MVESDDSRQPTRKTDLAGSLAEDLRTALTGDAAVGSAAARHLHEMLTRDGFRLEGKDLVAFPAPFVLSVSQVRELTRAVRAVCGILEQICRQALSSVPFLKQLGISPNVEELALKDSPGRLAIEIARFDFLPTPGGPMVLECNVDSPAGAVYAGLLDRNFLQLEHAKAICKDRVNPSAPGADLLVDALLAAWHESPRATVEKPAVAVVDFANVSTLPEQMLVVEKLRARGYDADHVDPRHFEFRARDRGLYSDGKRYHLIYRRALVPELARRRVLVAEFLRGIAHAEAAVFNPVRSRLAGNKQVLEVLTSAAWDRFFSPAENHARNLYFPWTRLLAQRKTDYRGREIDLLPFIAERPEKFVLKPGGGHGGQGVVLGPFCEKSEWEQRVDEFLATGGVVQEYVPAHEHAIVLPDGGEEKKFLTLGAFSFRGEYAGCLARVGKGPVVNVSNGGGMVPVLELGGRSKTSHVEMVRTRTRRFTRKLP